MGTGTLYTSPRHECTNKYGHALLRCERDGHFSYTTFLEGPKPLYLQYHKADKFFPTKAKDGHILKRPKDRHMLSARLKDGYTLPQRSRVCTIVGDQ